MSFRANDASMNQTSILDATALMSDREKRFLDKSWAKVFAEEIFPLIDEQQFAPILGYLFKDILFQTSGVAWRPVYKLHTQTPVHSQIAEYAVHDLGLG